MSNFNVSSPSTNDPITKLQNLLNNSLSSLIDVLSNLAYVGEAKELTLETAETSEYNEFVEKFKQLRENTNDPVTSDTEKEEQEEEEEEEEEEKEKEKKEKQTKTEGHIEITQTNIEKPITEQIKKKKNDVFIKTNFDDSVKTEILDRVERVNLILEKMNECIDDLPDCSVSEEERCKEMKFLQKVKDEKMLELKELYIKYDSLYNSIKKSLRETALGKS